MSKRHPATLPGHEALSRLARDNPQSFETLRTELIEDCFNSASEPMRLRLRQLQFRIDGVRQRSRSPLGAAIKVNALMWECFLLLNDELNEFAAQARSPSLQEQTGAATSSPIRQATILQFAPRRPKRPSPG